MSSIRDAALREHNQASAKKQTEREQRHADHINACLRHGLPVIQYATGHNQPQEIQLIAAGESDHAGRFQVHILIDGIHFSIMEPPYAIRGEGYSTYVYWHCPNCGAESSEFLQGLKQIGEVVHGRYCKECAQIVHQVKHSRFKATIAIPSDKDALKELDILATPQEVIDTLSLPLEKPALPEGLMRALTDG